MSPAGGSTIVSDRLIRRLIKAYPELLYRTNPDDNDQQYLCWNGWQSMIIKQADWPDPVGPGELLSEDYAFCERIIEVHKRDGGEPVCCYVDPYVHHTHWVRDADGNDKEYNVHWFLPLLDKARQGIDAEVVSA